MSGAYMDNIANEYKNLIQKYDRLGWKTIPLEGKKPFWKRWDDPKMWRSQYSNDATIRTLELDNGLNVGIVTGELSGVIAIDIDNPKLAGFREDKLKGLINQGVLAHTTSKAPRLIFRSSNPEVLNFSKKLVKKRNEVSEELISEADKGKEVITILEILGNGRQFVAPPSIHPRTGNRLKWISPLPEKPEDIYEIEDLNHLKRVHFQLFDPKIVLEIFGDLQKAERERTEVGDDVLDKWFNIIIKHLDVAKEGGNYILCHCPFHPPDNHPSFAVYRNTYLAIDFHDGSVYTLKELAEKLGIELPKRRKSEKDFEEAVKEFGLDRFGITADDLKELSLTILDIEETKDGEIRVKGVKHGAFAQWLRKRFYFATNSITEEIWMYHEDDGLWKPDGEAFIKEICEKILLALGYPEFATIRRIAEVVHHIKRFPQITPDKFNRAWREGWINCKNGVLNIYTKEFKPHSPDFFFTWKIEAEYNPEAKGEVVERFLSTVSEDRELLEEIIAYTLVSGQPFKKFFVLLGPTDSGKSTFIYLIEQFLGENNSSNVALQQLEKNRFAPAELVGKLANLFADLPPQKLDACPVLKAITGEDTIYVEKKFQKGYFSKIDAKIIFSANTLPDVDETDAFWNRVVIVRFPHRFPKNEKFKEELTKPEELSALLNIALKAIPRLFEKRFESGDINKAVKLWKIASDPLSVFIDERIEIIYTADDEFIDSEIYEFKGDVFDEFKRFCREKGVESKYASDYNLFVRAFTRKLAERGIRLAEGKKERDGKQLRIWWGIRIRRYDDNHNVDNRDLSSDNDDPSGFIDERELKEEFLEELLKDDEEDSTKEDEGETVNSTENEEKSSAKREDGKKEESGGEKLHRCVCGFETTDWREFDRHRAFCDEFQAWQSKEAKKTMEKIFGKHDEEEDEEDGEEKEEETKDNNRECEKTAKINDEANDSPDFSVLINGDVKYVTIRVLEDLPEFVGLDEKIYTLKAGEVVKIPEINALPLIRHGKAVEIKEGDFG